jgi:hypothetical protein
MRLGTTAAAGLAAPVGEPAADAADTADAADAADAAEAAV